ncbi:hypothetical protein [Micromonospora sp. ATCC 39149]|uniref:hypothetical protein n=1 Tax=Micromonospora sp. (strain ATCC 39149 / NRRL 15099 / SCC 1413) TaxID=219305 RepID=UPI0002EA3505|nr:hypothetical protein [Micromonospora sp. ATCC 39149]
MTALRATALVALAALAAGCQSDDTADDPAAAPVTTASTAPPASTEPFAATSTPAVTAAQHRPRCAGRVDRLILAGSKKLAADSAEATRDKATADELNSRLKQTIAGLAGDVREQAARAEDPEIEKLIADVAKQLDGGAKAASPAKWMGDTFVDIPPRLARECHA